ncbi:hypothetical protein As57867_001832, partial [Aphanomyces stellatus]
NGKSALISASEDGHAEVVRMLLDHGGVDINIGGENGKSALISASMNGHAEVVRMLLDHGGVDINVVDRNGISALISASMNGHAEVVRVLLDHGGVDINVVERYGQTALIRASENGHAEVVRVLLDHGGVDINVVDEVRALTLDASCVLTKGMTALSHAIRKDDLETVRLLSERNDIIIKKDVEYSIHQKKFAALATILESQVTYRTTNDVSVEFKWFGKYLKHESAMNMLGVDLPVEVQDGNLVHRQDYSYSWASFMDVAHPVDVNVRLSCLESILKDEKFASCSQELLRELAFGKDKHGREVIQITDATTRQYFYDRLYYCGRYEIFEGPPVNVSNTAVVVKAYDHGICAQVYRDYLREKNPRGLDVAGFIQCNNILGRLGAKIVKKDEKKKWLAEFQQWDKDGNGLLSEEEFMSFSAQQFGKKLTVAMKFMKNSDEYRREIEYREDLDTTFIMTLLPSVDHATIQSNAEYLKVRAGYSLINYPHVMVMPAADRSLEDIFLKECPDENELRMLLQQVAEGLQHLHANDIVHGDLKKLNVVRAGNRLKLIDLDAATKIGDPVGAKFSSGSLPPGAIFYRLFFQIFDNFVFVEMFHKLKSKEETNKYCKIWNDVKSNNPKLWHKLEPKNGFVVKTFRNQKDRLPYKLVKARPSLDVWAFGALMYQMHCGEELVATDFNQDVVDDRIEFAVTWTQEKLKIRIHNKIPNAQARDLLEKLLVVDPNDRIAMGQVLTNSYFKVDSANVDVMGAIEKLQDTSTTIVKILDSVIELSKEHLQQLASMKHDIMRGVFEATEVTIPTSFVILDSDLTKPLDEKGEKQLDNPLMFMCNSTIQFGKSLTDAVNGKTVFLSSGDDVYLYLVDEVDDTKKTYAGLRRTYASDGHVLWTSAKNVEKINADKARPDTLAVEHEQSNKIVSFCKELLLFDKEEKKNENSSGEDTPDSTQAKKCDEETTGVSDSGSTEMKTMQQKIENGEKACSCELM